VQAEYQQKSSSSGNLRHLPSWQGEKRPRRFSTSRPYWGRPHPPTSWSGVLCISIVTAQTSVGV